MAKVSVLGMGYIGLPTAAILATHGHDVCGVDLNSKIVDGINAGQPHIEEKGLTELIRKSLAQGTLRATLKPELADIYLIIVPTPFIEADKRPDMSYVRKAAADIAPLLKSGDMVILESTSSVGATRHDVMDVILALRPELSGELFFAFCPERAIPGDTMRELVENDRVVGGVDEASTAQAVAFYQTFVKGEVLAASKADTAELVKLVENSFRDVNIAFANELSLICDKLALNVWDVIRLANHHPRVNILQPGPGVGGHCIAVDPWFIVDAAKDEARLIKTARQVNDSKPHWVVEKIKSASQKCGKQMPVITLLGLSFKPNVEDLRESPSVKIAHLLQKEMQSAKILCVEPHITEHTDFELIDLIKGLQMADVVVMLTDHEVFKELNLSLLSGKEIVDTRGVFNFG